MKDKDKAKPRLSRVERNKRHKKKKELKHDDFEKTVIYHKSNISDEGDFVTKKISHTMDQAQLKKSRVAKFHRKDPEDVLHEGENKDLRRGRRERSSDKGKKRFFTWKKMLGFFAVLLLVCLIGYTAILFGGRILVNDEKLTITPPTTIETEDGEILWYLYDEFRLPVNIEDVPQHVQDAFVAIEDKRFYKHTGVDFRSIMRAVYRDVITRSKAEGASTLTQQLAKNLFLTNDKTFLRKTKEVMIALHLEREYTKDEILEMYLNVVYFGQGQYGIEAAANKYFYKSVDELTLEEAALLAAMVKAPNGYSPIEHPEKAETRRNLVLQTMFEEDYITEAEMKEAQNKEMTLNISNRKQNAAYHSFVDLVIKETIEELGVTEEDLRNKRYKIVTSLNTTFQEVAYDYFQSDYYFQGTDDEVEGAFVMLDRDGKIVAALGGRQYQFKNYNRVYTKRQPGSTMKPLAVYGPALMSGDYEPYSMLPDEKQEWDGHVVRNVNDQYEGSVSLYDALRVSKNTSAVWLYEELGYKYVSDFLNKMDIPLENEGFNIALGGLKDGVSPLQMAQAYSSFLREGQMVEAHSLVSVSDYKGKVLYENKTETSDVFSEQVAWTMTELLKSVVTSGTATSGDYPYELAGKTGSTQHDHVEGATKDAWFVGYTPEYVTSLWIGYDKSNEDQYLTAGSAYPTMLTKGILNEISKQAELKQTFEKPEGVVALEEPIQLPIIESLTGKFTFGGWKILKGKLSWEAAEADDRVVYRIYEYDEDEPILIDEVIGETEYELDSVSLFNQKLYYVVPYNPQTQEEGNRSEVISLSF